VKGLKFRRQEPIGQYIVDFVCYERRLVIEVDGGHHATSKNKDEVRDKWLKGQGFKVIRFWNNDVLKNPSGVLEEIIKYCALFVSPSPNPSHRGRGTNSRILTSSIIVICISLLGKCTSDQFQVNFNINWERQSSVTDASLRGLCVVSDNIVWASGSQGTVLRTVDGGETWQRLPVPDTESMDFRDVHAFNELEAVIVSAGQPAKILKTTDGGLHWVEKYYIDHPDAFFDAMAFWDVNTGIVFSDPVDGAFLLIKTTDGGESWHRIPPKNIPPPMDGEAGFAASGSCIAVYGQGYAWFGTGGSAARVFRSSDWGETWSAAETPLLSGQPSAGIFSLTFRDAKNGVAIGGDYRNPTATENNTAFTTDGGVSWAKAQRSPPDGFRSCVAYVPTVSPPVLVTVGTNGSDFSSDGGRTWARADTVGYHAVDFAKNKKIGWVVGSEARIAKITVGGKR
jgi:photosystem II stability/assembly factor-like uncharacterized protein